MVEQQTQYINQQSMGTQMKQISTSHMQETMMNAMEQPIITGGVPMSDLNVGPNPSVYSYYADHWYRSDSQWQSYLESEQFKNYWNTKASNPTTYRMTQEYVAHRGMKQRIKSFVRSRMGRNSKTYRSLPQWITYTQSPAYQNYISLKKNNPNNYRTFQEYQQHLAFKNSLKGKRFGTLNRLFHFRNDKDYKRKPEWGQYILSSEYARYRDKKLTNPTTYKTMPEYQIHFVIACSLI